MLAPKPGTRPNHVGRFSKIRDPCTLPKTHRVPGVGPRALSLQGSFGFGEGLGRVSGLWGQDISRWALTHVPVCPIWVRKQQAGRAAQSLSYPDALAGVSERQTLRHEDMGQQHRPPSGLSVGLSPWCLPMKSQGPASPAGCWGRPLAVCSRAALEPEGHPTPQHHFCPGFCPGPDSISRGLGCACAGGSCVGPDWGPCPSHPCSCRVAGIP